MIEEPPALRQLLGTVFPRLALDRVRLRRGIPHLFRRLRPGGITLPHPFVPGRVEIFLRPGRYDPGTSRGLDLLLHESFHALQYQEAGGRWGTGFLHPFFVLYVACLAGAGLWYPAHPLERDAFSWFGGRRSRFRRDVDQAAIPWEKLAPDATEPLDAAELAQLRTALAPVVVETSRLRPWRRLAASCPLCAGIFELLGVLPWWGRVVLGVPLVPLAVVLLAFWTLLAIGFCGLIWGLVSAVEVAGRVLLAGR